MRVNSVEQLKNKKALFLLSAEQAIIMITIKVNLLVASLASLLLHSSKHLATLPITLMILASLIGALIARYAFSYFGKKLGHAFGMIIGNIGLILCVFGLQIKNLMVFNTGSALVGILLGFSLSYRFTAAAEANDLTEKAKAVSYIVFAGIFAAIIGPVIAERTRDLLAIPYLATYAALWLINFLGLLAFLSIKLKNSKVLNATGFTLKACQAYLCDYRFVTGSIATSICYFVMTFVMVGTPLAMSRLYHYPFATIAFAMQLHFLGMFGPGIFVNKLVKKIGIQYLFLIGVIIYFICTVILTTGTTLENFYLGLLLLGIGWNFIFISGTSLITSIDNPQQANNIQSINNILTALGNTLGALVAGPLVFTLGWIKVNLIVLPFSAILLITAVIYLIKLTKT